MTLPDYQSVPIDHIVPSRHQARKNIPDESIQRLADSLKAEGLLQAITVRQVGETFELISGERRLRAAKLLGWITIDAKVIQTVSEAEAAAKGMVENLQREDLNPIEEAQGLADLNQLDPGFWNQAKIAEVTGKTQSHVSETLRLLKLPEQIKDNIRIRIISPDNGAELVRLPNAELQLKAADVVVKKGLNGKETRALVNKLLKVAKPKKSSRPNYDAVFQEMWPNLMADTAIKACGYWGVEYKNDKWYFSIGAETITGADDFAAWFRQLGDAIARQAVMPADRSPASSDESEQQKAAEEDAKQLGKLGRPL